MRIYKTYFDKSDTPFVQEFQKNRKYHTVWKRRPYDTFLGHKVVMVKKFGLFNVKGKSDPFTMLNDFIESR